MGKGGVVTTDGDWGGDNTGAFSVIILVITCLVTIRYLVLNKAKKIERFPTKIRSTLTF